MASAQFELFRLSLVERERQPSLFVELNAELPARESYLRGVFGRRQDFKHFGNDFSYVPVPEATGALVAGRIGKARKRAENLPPEQGLAPAEHTAWTAIDLLLDPAHHADGQKLYLTRETAVGKTDAVIRSLVKHLNSIAEPPPPFHMEVESIFDGRTFWEFAARHQGTITSLTFEFTTPNMFGTKDTLNEELRNFRKREGAERVTVRMTSGDGINTETGKVKESVDYVEKGQGSIVAKAKDGDRYSSKKMTRVISVPDAGPDDAQSIVRAAKALEALF